MSLPPNSQGGLLNPFGKGHGITPPPTANFYQQEGNTDVYIQETADKYIQE